MNDESAVGAQVDPTDPYEREAGGSDASRYATSRPGIFAIGDVRAGSTKRVASAVGEGSIVVSDSLRFLEAARG